MNKVPGQGALGFGFRIVAFLFLLGFGFFLLLAVDFDLERALNVIQATNPFSFVLCMSLLPLLGFPIAAFYLYAGSAFPWWQAWMLCSISLAINLTLAYPLAKFLLKEPIAALLQRYQKSLPVITEENHFRLTFLVRSVPGIPFFIQNYFLPVMGVRFVQYWIISWLIQSTFAAGMTAVPKLVEHKGWVVAGIVFALIGLLGLFRRFYLKKKAPEATDIAAKGLTNPSASNE